MSNKWLELGVKLPSDIVKCLQPYDANVYSAQSVDKALI